MSRLLSAAVGFAATAVAALAIATPGASASVAGPQIPRSAIGSIAWGTCAQSDLAQAGAECGLLSVPLNYQHPYGAHIQIAVSRIEHTSSPQDYQGIILTNPGGPGGSGLDLNTFLIPVLQQEGYTSAAADYDWIGFDPRGVGSSVPALSCDNNYFNGPRGNYTPLTTTLLNYWETRSDAYGAACAAASPAQLALLQNDTTVDSADDMDAIREALGQPQITYYGFSYGTYLGQVYGTLYPTHVRRMILDSTVDPRGVWTQDNYDQDIAFNKNMNIWFAWLAQYNDVYGLGSTEAAVESLFYKTRDALFASPAGGVVGGDEWTDTFLDAGYYEETWLGLGQLFSDYIQDPAATTTDLVQQYEATDGVGDDNEFADYLGVQCTDAAWPGNYSAFVATNWSYALRAPYETWGNAWFNAPCLHWPVSPSSPVRIDLSGVSSGLMIDETLDPATPFPGSLYVHNQLFPHSVLIAEPGGTSHADSLFGDLCVDDTIGDYLATGALPAKHPNLPWDKTCAPLPKPVPTASSSTSDAPVADAGALARSQRFMHEIGVLGAPAVTAG